MWCLTMFDAPVVTAEQRRAATAFRHMLLDRGFTRLQLSVYVRYAPSSTGIHHTVAAVRAHLPPGARVCVLLITDHQWAQAVRIFSEQDPPPPDPPDQLTIF